ncbi:bile acid:sodium symporter family protein [Halomicronema sp. CCY15110]|uniref:bile acid:sodium symporter family protein n=1 Tax=Halomicronema sp. CCY15110 TaxID=2767773 RepID=UPI00195288F5|nr:bile acid:sodium symporter [Halomicronema sp. CCY15110]
MTEIIAVLANLATLIFVISSMLALGLSLTVKLILAPLANVNLVARALGVNFVLVPLVAFGLKTVIPLEPSLGIGLMLLATAAGAPFLPKLAQAAKADVAFSVGLMVLLMVVTVVYVPVVLPLLLPGVSVNPLEIARSLIILMLLPLAIGLVIKARYAEIASSLQPHMAQASTVSLLAVLVLMLVLNFDTMVGAIGSGAMIVAILFILISLALGYWLGPTAGTRPVLGLGTAQRNIAAAMVVATGNFGDDPNVLTMILVGAVLMLVILMPLAGELGRRA